MFSYYKMGFATTVFLVSQRSAQIAGAADCSRISSSIQTTLHHFAGETAAGLGRNIIDNQID